MIRLLIAAPASGCGKTVLTCALLTAFRNRGLNPCAFKCGPDYIDPMFHRAVLGAESHNLDLFLSDPERARTLFSRASRGRGAAVCESAMGFYDGLGGVTDRASAWRIADALRLPVLLVVPAKGVGLSLAASVRGLRDFRPNSHIRGVLLNDCPSALARTLAPTLERETGAPVLGSLPRTAAAEIGSRHLGLRTAAEIENLQARFDILADTLERNVDMERLLKLYDVPETSSDAEISENKSRMMQNPECKSNVARNPERKARIAVARDEAFCFLYAETLEILEASGAELTFFSPLRDAVFPQNVGGLYLPGGYPELHAQQLSENASMRGAIADAVRGGLPTVAECGGFLYLGATLRASDGISYPMAGVLSGDAFPRGKLVRFGYVTLSAASDSLLFRVGESVPAHEFHYWDSSENGTALQAEKPITGRRWRCGFVNESLYAAFPHLYFAGRPELAERFVSAARKYQERTFL